MDRGKRDDDDVFVRAQEAKHFFCYRLVMIPHCGNTGEAMWFYTRSLDCCAYQRAFAGSITCGEHVTPICGQRQYST
jgi:hypothetical protein